MIGAAMLARTEQISESRPTDPICRSPHERSDMRVATTRHQSRISLRSSGLRLLRSPFHGSPHPLDAMKEMMNLMTAIAG